MDLQACEERREDLVQQENMVFPVILALQVNLDHVVQSVSQVCLEAGDQKGTQVFQVQ